MCGQQEYNNGVLGFLLTIGWKLYEIGKYVFRRLVVGVTGVFFLLKTRSSGLSDRGLRNGQTISFRHFTVKRSVWCGRTYNTINPPTTNSRKTRRLVGPKRAYLFFSISVRLYPTSIRRWTWSPLPSQKPIDRAPFRRTKEVWVRPWLSRRGFTDRRRRRPFRNRRIPRRMYTPVMSGIIINS